MSEELQKIKSDLDSTTNRIMELEEKSLPSQESTQTVLNGGDSKAGNLMLFAILILMTVASFRLGQISEKLDRNIVDTQINQNRLVWIRANMEKEQD